MVLRRSPQLSLFGPEPVESAAPISPFVPPDFDEVARALGERFPQVKFGTSSWTFPGWSGVVYPPNTSARQLAKAGLRAYASNPLFRAVGVDRSYYAPISVDEIANYKEQLSASFNGKYSTIVPLVKAWNALTTVPTGGTASGGSPNCIGEHSSKLSETYLRPDVFLETSLRRWGSEGESAEKTEAAIAPIHLLEFAPMPSGARTPGAFATELEAFFSLLPSGLRLAVEVRNEHLVSPRVLAVLREQGASFVYNQWTSTLPIADQIARHPPPIGVPVVARLLLPSGARYADKKQEFEPFSAIQVVQPGVRSAVVSLIVEALRRGAPEIVITVNNKLEGCAPLTVLALAKLLLAERPVT